MLLEVVIAVVTSIACFVFGYVIGKSRFHRLYVKRARRPEINAEIERILSPLKLTQNTLLRVIERLEEEMKFGLSPSKHAKCDMKMFPTYVRHLPKGNEHGEALALDLGGTNFRVLHIILNGSTKKPTVNSKIFVIPQSVMQGEGDELFNHLANSLSQFLEAENLTDSYVLGFTFSFPCIQDGLTSARLSHWTKGFSCSNTVGRDVVAMLQKAIDRKNLKVRVVALINDTVGTLVACAYSEPHTAIGLIVGTGFNSCYVEHLDNVGTWNGDYNDPKQVVINTEWGAFGSNGCLSWLRTPYDDEIDKSSINPGEQIFEKMISGMYMGEIVRLIILDLMEKNLLFIGHLEGYMDYGQALFTKGAFFAKYVSDIETDDGIHYANTKSVLQQLGVKNPTYEDCAIIQYVCKLVSKRAGALTAAGLAVLINRITNPMGKLKMYHHNIVVGIDGSVYRYHPKFHKNITKPLDMLVSKEINYKLKLSEDGSGIGAALVAYIHSLYSSEDQNYTRVPDGDSKKSNNDPVQFTIVP